jgi:hypothetical protein
LRLTMNSGSSNDAKKHPSEKSTKTTTPKEPASSLITEEERKRQEELDKELAEVRIFLTFVFVCGERTLFNSTRNFLSQLLTNNRRKKCLIVYFRRAVRRMDGPV